MGGRKFHLKRLVAPKHWLLGKLEGNYAPCPNPGPHKKRECLPIVILLRNKLRYASTYQEAKKIALEKNVKIDGRVRTDHKYPVGLMDVVTLEKTKENLRILYDVKGRFVAKKIKGEEAKFKLCRVKRAVTRKGGVRCVITHDGRCLPYALPNIKTHDTVKYDFNEKKIKALYKFRKGCQVMVTGGHSIGRVGKITEIVAQPGSHDTVTIEDATGATFKTRIENTFVIGKKQKCVISLPRDEGIARGIVQDRQERLERGDH